MEHLIVMGPRIRGSSLQACSQQAQLVLGRAVFAAAMVTASVCETIDGESKLHTVQRERFKQAANFRKGRKGFHLTETLLQ
jgi:hypothetical protein